MIGCAFLREEGEIASRLGIYHSSLEIVSWVAENYLGIYIYVQYVPKLLPCVLMIWIIF